MNRIIGRFLNNRVVDFSLVINAFPMGSTVIDYFLLGRVDEYCYLDISRAYQGAPIIAFAGPNTIRIIEIG